MNVDVQRIAAAIVSDLEAAWNAADGERFARPFTDDADFVTIRGEHHRTRAAIAHGHQAIFDTIYKGSVLHYEVAAARPIAPGVIVAQAHSTLEAPTGPLAGAHSGISTLVLVDQQGQWRVAAFHNTLVK